ncbi:MAG: hypothetical protein VSS75_029140 [Candidatus Parabeggiatoa sp.]|nr:hypothetical protein [Candidatus Parabeggiatoa sp.]
MSHFVYLVTNETVKSQELTTFLKRVDAIIDEKNEAKGYVLNGEGQVWIDLVENAIDEYEPEDIEKLRDALGASPKTFICLDISRNPGSGRLAIEVAEAFSQRWYSVIDDLYENIYTSDDLHFLQRHGGEL